MRSHISYDIEIGWIEYLSNWIHMKENNELSYIYGQRDVEFKSKYGLYHIMANRTSDKETKYDIKLLTASYKGLGASIVAIICLNDEREIVMEFDNDGQSVDTLWELSVEYVHFDKGDYVATDMGAIGIYANNEWLSCGIWNDKSEYVRANSCGVPIRLCTQEEIDEIDNMLYVHNKKYNKETNEVEDI